MGKIWAILLFLTSLFGAEVHESVWRKGETFSDYLERNNVPVSLIKNISADDAKYLSEIHAGEHFYELTEGGRLLQALIPIGEEMQIQLVKKIKGSSYRFDIIPIVYREVEDMAVVEIRQNCYSDIDRLTHNARLGFLLKGLYKGSVDFRKFRQGDRVAFGYRQKSRLGLPWGQPLIKAAVVESGGKKHFVFVDGDGNVWNDVYRTVRYTKTGRKEAIYTRTKKTKRGKQSGNGFIMPIRGARITSRFTYKRWHPILHRYRPHLGVDWGARRGTPLYAVSNGRVIYAGWMRGYGKVVKIDHGRGYVSLYAHQSRIKVRKGSYVKKGEVIGYVGSTGRSTGPHLHFGLYKNGRAINPLKVLKYSGSSGGAVRTASERYRKMKKYTMVKIRKIPIKGARLLKKQLNGLLKKNISAAYRWEEFKNSSARLWDRKHYETRGKCRWAAN